MIIPWVLQLPSEIGLQSGDLWGKFMWANAKSPLTRPGLLPAELAKKLASASCPCWLSASTGNHLAAVSPRGLSLLWAPLLSSPWRQEKTPHPVLSKVVLSPHILKEFLVRTSGTVSCFWFGWFCFTNSVWDESSPLLPAPRWQCESQTRAPIYAQPNPLWRPVLHLAYRMVFSFHLPWS